MYRFFVFILTMFSFLLSGSDWQNNSVLIQQVNTIEHDQEEAVVYHDEETIEWLSWEQAMDSLQVNKKKILVDVYTQWCGWCKKMDKTTFRDPEIVEYINKTYYAVKFDAEQKESIEFNGEEYKFVTGAKGRGYHQLALALTKGRLSYPSFVFLNEDASVIQPIPGYKDPATFEVIMTYFGGNFHQRIPWQKYQESYIPLEEKDILTKD